MRPCRSTAATASSRSIRRSAAYRDSRVNRIFEGTNEINRQIAIGWMLKKAMSGQLALMPAIKKVLDEVMAGP